MGASPDGFVHDPMESPTDGLIEIKYVSLNSGETLRDALLRKHICKLVEGQNITIHRNHGSCTGPLVHTYKMVHLNFKTQLYFIKGGRKLTKAQTTTKMPLALFVLLIKECSIKNTVVFNPLHKPFNMDSKVCSGSCLIKFPLRGLYFLFQ